jgi:hypothetical protein
LHGFDCVRDLYSLGVILFEVTLWQPISEKIAEKEELLEDMAASQIRAFLLQESKDLEGVVGPLYRNAVEACLTGDFGISRDDDGEGMGWQGPPL